MKLLNYRIVIFTLICFAYSSDALAQQGSITLNQDARVDKLLAVKKDMNRNDDDAERYKIQIYSGNRASAEVARSQFNRSIGKWRNNLVYETPNYKVWVGSFRTRLEADRALIDVKRKFPSAFIFKPKK